MRDFDVRSTLREAIRAQHGPDFGPLILDELGICGGIVRADLAVIDDLMHGYEIKSDSDTVERLPHQAKAYGEVFDRATLVVGERLYSKARKLLPDWWGIMIAVPIRRGLVHLRQDRTAQDNPEVKPFEVAGLLWREELLGLLHEAEALEGLKSTAREFLQFRLTQVYERDELRIIVRNQLKERPDWRMDPDSSAFVS